MTKFTEQEREIMWRELTALEKLQGQYEERSKSPHDPIELSNTVERIKTCIKAFKCALEI